MAYRWAGIMLASALALTGCGEGPDPAGNTSAPAAPLTAADVAGALQKAGLPVTDVTALTPATDPDKLLGKPGQYTSKAFFYDRRHPSAAGQAGRNTVEVFASVADAMKRGEVLSQVSNLDDINQRQMIQGKLYLRLGRALSAAEAGEYRKVLLDKQIGL